MYVCLRCTLVCIFFKHSVYFWKVTHGYMFHTTQLYMSFLKMSARELWNSYFELRTHGCVWDHTHLCVMIWNRNLPLLTLFRLASNYLKYIHVNMFLSTLDTLFTLPRHKHKQNSIPNHYNHQSIIPIPISYSQNSYKIWLWLYTYMQEYDYQNSQRITRYHGLGWQYINFSKI